MLDSLDGVASQLVSLITYDLQRAEPLFFNSTRTLYGQILTRLDGIDSSFRQSSIAWEGALEQVGETGSVSDEHIPSWCTFQPRGDAAAASCMSAAVLLECHAPPLAKDCCKKLTGRRLLVALSQLVLALLIIIMLLVMAMALATWLGLPAGITAAIVLLGGAAIVGFGLAAVVAVVLIIVNDACGSGDQVSRVAMINWQ